MSPDIEDVVRSGYGWVNSKKRPDPSLWCADGEYVAAAEDPDAATHRGIEAITEQFGRWFDAYPDLRVEPLEIRANGDRVFVWVRFSGHGAGSGLPVDMELAHVWTVNPPELKLKRIEEYTDRSEALQAVGLTE